MNSNSGIENAFETYLQGHIHPEVQPLFRREVKLGTISMEGFLRLARHFQANHEAFDAQLENQATVIEASKRFEDRRIEQEY